jgi:hypothetical protein
MCERQLIEYSLPGVSLTDTGIEEEFMKILLGLIVLFTICSFVNPWEHKLIDIIDINGLRIEVDIKPQMLIGFTREWHSLCIGMPFCDLWIQWGKDIIKGGPRG